jgi:PhoPQ-activated pathogenicity-related protein
MIKKYYKYNAFLLLICGLSLNLFAQNATLTGTAEVTPSNALEYYIGLEDGRFEWELKETTRLENVTVNQLLVTSQEWRGHVWRHQLTMFVPQENEHDGALLFISGGSNKEEQPNWSKEDRMWPALAAMAEKNKAIVSILKQTPNQPLYGDLTEDELISYTFHNFRADQDYTWPLLFPMVKSALKAMDAIQEFSSKELDHPVHDFVISGASKRGWTTWLTAATGDPRVKAIAPMVIDILNMPVNLQYQLDSYGEYSEQIQDYVNLGIVQSIATEEGKALTAMIDPYSYRKDLTVPKMIFIGTNDEYWTVDAIKHYYDDIPGQNMIHYVPNVGHDLGGGKQALEGLSAFFGITLQDKPYPVVTWEIDSGKKSSSLQLKMDDPALIDAVLWSVTSEDRDFRDEKWTGRSLGKSNVSRLKIQEDYPSQGYKAFYIDLKYNDPHGGTYTVSTRMFLMDEEGVM